MDPERTSSLPKTRPNYDSGFRQEAVNLKLIQRRAYGFRNFQNYRLRVIAQRG